VGAGVRDSNEFAGQNWGTDDNPTRLLVFCGSAFLFSAAAMEHGTREYADGENAEIDQSGLSANRILNGATNREIKLDGLWVIHADVEHDEKDAKKSEGLERRGETHTATLRRAYSARQTQRELAEVAAGKRCPAANCIDRGIPVTFSGGTGSFHQPLMPSLRCDRYASKSFCPSFFNGCFIS
jgi:hypothetical protein